MYWIITKFALTAAMVVLISEVAKRSDRLGGLIAALPTMTILTLIWLHLEKTPADKIGNHAFYTFWYVLPTLPMFLGFPFLLSRLGFWPALGVSMLVTIGCFIGFGLLMRHFGLKLF